MYYYRIQKTSALASSIRCIQTAAINFSAGRYEKLKRKSANRSAFPPAFQTKLKVWPKQLQREVDYEAKAVGESLQSSGGDFTELEERGIAFGNLQYVSEEIDPLNGRIIHLRKSTRGGKKLKNGVPVAVCESSNMFPVAECIVLGSNRDVISLKVLRCKRTLMEDYDYAVLPSSSMGAVQSLQEFLAKDLSHSSVINKDLIEFAYRTKPMPSVHNDRIPNDVGLELNESQSRAVAASLNKRRPFVCIQGPPGTGKTKVVAEVLRLLIHKKELTLVCAPTNVAVDNVYNKTVDVLKHNGATDSFIDTALIRVNHASEVVESHEKFLDLVENSVLLSQAINEKDEKGAHKLQKDVDQMKLKMIKESFRKSMIVFCTVGSSIVQKLRKFNWNPDVLIIDESAQCLEPSVWAAIVKAKRCVLVGDPAQLPTLVKCPENKKDRLEVSLMERLNKEFSSSNINQLLTTQYRMNANIMNWSSCNFYDDRLVADDSVRNQKLSDVYELEPNHPFNANMILFDTDLDLVSYASSYDIEQNHSFENPGEATLVAQYLSQLFAFGVSPSKIGVISPYYAQVQQIKRLIDDDNVHVNSVDGFQGQEREVILFSLVRNNHKGSVGFSDDNRRLNVAVTRAQKQFVIIGSGRMMKKSSRLASLYRYISVSGRILNPAILSSVESSFTKRSQKVV